METITINCIDNTIPSSVNSFSKKIYDIGKNSFVTRPLESTKINTKILTPKLSKEPINEVMTALENNEYDWRTIDGIANETKLPIDIISQTIKIIDKDIIRSPIPDEKGRSLYTTRRHYYKTRGLISRFITAVSGRIRA